MKKCVVDIRYHAAVGNYSRIPVVLTSHQGERKDARNKKKWKRREERVERIKGEREKEKRIYYFLFFCLPFSFVILKYYANGGIRNT